MRPESTAVFHHEENKKGHEFQVSSGTRRENVRSGAWGIKASLGSRSMSRTSPLVWERLSALIDGKVVRLKVAHCVSIPGFGRIPLREGNLSLKIPLPPCSLALYSMKPRASWL